MKADDARELALSLPEAGEQDHHGFPSFRVGSKIFATLPDPGRLHVMLDAEQVPDALDALGDAAQKLIWGSKLAGVAVALGAADRRALSAQLRVAWRRVAPKTLLKQVDEPPTPGTRRGRS